MSILKRAALINAAAEREPVSFAANAKAVIDATFEALYAEGRVQQIQVPTDDRIARVEEALAIALEAADEGLQWNLRLEEQRQAVEELEREAPNRS